MVSVLDTPVLTGRDLQQVFIGDVLITPTGETQQKLRDAISNVATGRNAFSHGLSFWPDGTNFDSFPSNTGALTAFGLYGARTGYADGMEVQRKAALGSDAYYSARILRTSGDASTAALNCALIMTQDETRFYAGQLITAQIMISGGEGFTAVNGAVTVELITTTSTLEQSITTSTAYFGSDNHVIKTIGGHVSTGERRAFRITTLLPASARQAALRISWTPSGTAPAFDYCAIEAPWFGLGTGVAFIAPQPQQFSPDVNNQIALTWTGTSAISTAEAPRQKAQGTASSGSVNFAFANAPGGLRAIGTKTLFNPNTGANNEMYDLTNDDDIAAVVTDGGPLGWFVTNAGATTDGGICLIQARDDARI